jgi:predicted ATP-grasp superfamily ATP-dependent carboligase
LGAYRLASQSDPSDFFVQEFVQGFDIDCSVLCEQGEILAYTIQKGIVRSTKPFAPPAAIEFVHDQGVLDSITRLVSSVSWSGVANFDLVFDGQTNEAKVLEANPRYWRSLHGSLQAGVNFPYLACLAGCGLSFNRPEYRHVRYAGPASAVRLILQKWLGNESWISGFAESGVLHILRDPCADMAIHLRRFGRVSGLM